MTAAELMNGQSAMVGLAHGPDAFRGVELAQLVLGRYQQQVAVGTRASLDVQRAALEGLDEEDRRLAADGLVFLAGAVPCAEALADAGAGSDAFSYRLQREIAPEVQLWVRGGGMLLVHRARVRARSDASALYLTTNYQPAEWLRDACDTVSAEVDAMLTSTRRTIRRDARFMLGRLRLARLAQSDYEREVVGQADDLIDALAYVPTASLDAIEAALGQERFAITDAGLRAVMASDPEACVLLAVIADRLNSAPIQYLAALKHDTLVAAGTVSA